MYLKSKAKPAIVAMVDLVMHQHFGPVTLIHISQRQHISLSYLEQLFSRFRRHKLVEAIRGPGGGYTLAQKPENISVADILGAVEDPFSSSVSKVSGETMQLNDLFAPMHDKLSEFLESLSLKTLVQENLKRGIVAENPNVPSKSAPRSSSEVKPPKPIEVNAPNSVFDLARVLD